MKIIVDAYNILHYINPVDRITDLQCKSFIKQLGAYARQKKHAIVAVFDGGPVLFSSCTKINGILVCYSGPGMSADEFILKYIKEHAGHNMILISSDKALCQAAAFYQVDSVKVEDFYQLLMQQRVELDNVVDMEGPVVKMNQSSSMIDALMMQSRVPCKIEDFQNPVESRASKAVKLSKKERKHMHKLKKL